MKNMGDAHDRILKILNEHKPDGDFVPSDKALEVRRYLEKNEPELLERWKDEMLTNWLRDAFRRMLNSQRSRTRAKWRAEAFGEKVRRHELGEKEIAFEVTYVVDEFNTRRPVADMTGRDHLFVASKYEETVEMSKFEASFHKAVARKVGSKRTEDVMTPTEYREMYEDMLRTARPGQMSA